MFDTLDFIVDLFHYYGGRKITDRLFDQQGNNQFTGDGIENLLAKTPEVRRSRRGGPQLVVEYKQNWLQQFVHKITPGRGRKKKTDVVAEAASLRSSECIGLVPVGLVKNPAETNGKMTLIKQRCALCGTNTSMYCLGCKRFLCMDKDRSAKLPAENCDDSDEVEDSSFAASVLKFKQVKVHLSTGEKESRTLYGCKSCYHHAHEAMFDKVLAIQAEQPSHLTRVLDPPAAECQSRFRQLLREASGNEDKLGGKGA